MPYDAGCIVVRDGSRQLETFGAEAAYLRREQRGLAAGGVWPCDLGPDLSRGFRALKVWMTLLVYGADRIGAVAQQTCDLAASLAVRIDREPALQRLAPVALNIVCFRFIGADGDLDRLNADIVADIQEAGIAAPSTTIVNGALAIRAAIVNHRTNEDDMAVLVDAVLEAGRGRVAAAGAKQSAPGCSPGASIQGGFTSGRRRSQRPLSSDWRWNSGGNAAVTRETRFISHLRREPLRRTGTGPADLACLTQLTCIISIPASR